MALEIEHKYLVKNDSYREMAVNSVEICQGYLSRNPDRTVRIRIKGEKGYLTVKTRNVGDVRHEFEYQIPVDDARSLLAACLPPVISKIRHIVPYRGHDWEVDEFQGDLKPLVVAEIELAEPGESYDLPPFVGKNVTGDPAYYNSNLGKSEVNGAC